MPIYSYTAVTAGGSVAEATLEAASEAEARRLLQSRGHQVMRLRQLDSSASREVSDQAGAVKGKRPSADEVAGTIRQMSILVRAGVPLVESLQGLSEQARSRTLSECLRRMASDVSQGMALSEAFARHPIAFPVLAAEMVRVAEAGGDLAESLEKLANHLESGAEVVRKVRSAMAYPIVVMAISIITVIVMVTFILPRFVKLFDQMGAKLPWSTKMLMTISGAMTGKWYLFVLGVAALVYCVKRYSNSPTGKAKIDRLLLKLPLVGDIVRKIVLGRVVATMATLLAGGVPMVKTLETSAAAANNEVVKEALLTARKDVAEGSTTYQALRATGVFPPIVLQMVASGEKTGELPAMLEYVCLLYARETDAKVKSLTSVIEPVMIVMLGVVVGFIAMSVIVPIYSLVGGVK